MPKWLAWYWRGIYLLMAVCLFISLASFHGLKRALDEEMATSLENTRRTVEECEKAKIESYWEGYSDAKNLRRD